ncbi:MAG: DUF5715 family protein [Muribaculaceae bacterium]|nr:DUF5715 family protein [Muribaculaceae bacterium]
MMKAVISVAVLGVLLLTGCGGSEAEQKREAAAVRLVHLDMRPDSADRYDTCLQAMPGGCIKLVTKPVGRLDEVFNDSNYVHWAAAEKIGLKPLSDIRSHWNLSRPVVRIASCEDFFLEPLTHSSPYLVPEAAQTVHEIGRRFRDTLQARGGGDYRIRITSVLRTPESIRRLKRRNSNAIDSSVHQLGTTVDISYNVFAADSYEVPRSAVDLKAVLAEVLYAMRAEGKLLVKYEKKQPCFHVTACKTSE